MRNAPVTPPAGSSGPTPLGVIAIVAVAGLACLVYAVFGAGSNQLFETEQPADGSLGTAITSTTKAIIKAAGFISADGDFTLTAGDITSTGGSTSLATTTVESFTSGGDACAITDANGGTYTLTAAEMAHCSVFELTASGAGQEVVALTFPATSTMTTLIPNAGDCKRWLYDASAVAAGTTTTMTAGTGHDVIAYTTNDDVIDGAEFAEIKMCRSTNTDVNTIVSELLHAD